MRTYTQNTVYCIDINVAQTTKTFPDGTVKRTYTPISNKVLPCKLTKKEAING